MTSSEPSKSSVHDKARAQALLAAALLSTLAFLSILGPFAWLSTPWTWVDVSFAALFFQVIVPAGFAPLIVLLLVSASRTLQMRNLVAVIALEILAFCLFVLTLPLSLIPTVLFAFCAFLGAQAAMSFAAAKMRATDPRPLAFTLLGVAGAASAPMVNLLLLAFVLSHVLRDLLLLQAVGAFLTVLGLTGNILLFAWALRETRTKERPLLPSHPTYSGTSSTVE